MQQLNNGQLKEELVIEHNLTHASKPGCLGLSKTLLRAGLIMLVLRSHKAWLLIPV